MFFGFFWGGVQKVRFKADPMGLYNRLSKEEIFETESIMCGEQPYKSGRYE